MIGILAFSHSYVFAVCIFNRGILRSSAIVRPSDSEDLQFDVKDVDDD